MNINFDILEAAIGTTEPPASQADETQTKWPDPLEAAALIGPVGEFVRRIEPHTEADPAAILVQLLAGFGNVIGRTAHFRAEADKHFSNISAVLVGQTSKGRKGTSWGRTAEMLFQIDENWPAPASGLSSGEGLIEHVRDADPDAEEDRGVSDKRLLVVEPEFARALQCARRDGSTLSAVIRQCFDTGNLQTLNRKTNSLRATGAHVSIIGHITKQELSKLLLDVEVANGFANRFLWVCVKRSKVLPDGGQAHLLDFDDLTRRFIQAFQFAHDRTELKRDSEARSIWHEVYPELSEGKPGLLGAVTGRAEALVMRLALIYAVLDCADGIRKEHLRAALAVWRYTEESARFIFGESLGDTVADEILHHLRRSKPEPITRVEISGLFNRHRSATEIDRALRVLAEANLATKTAIATAGRHAEAWVAV